MFRMEVYVFQALCNTLSVDTILESTRGVSVKEVIALFAYVVAHSSAQRIIANQFQHSFETINRHVYKVMHALCHFISEVIVPTQVDRVVPYILGNPGHYLWF